MEKENKFTPGPWSVGKYSANNYQIAVYGSDQTKICMLEGWNDEFIAEAEANASLISSAPDLLAACERMIPYMERAIEVEAFKGCFIPDSARQAMLNAIDVINKAKGE